MMIMEQRLREIVKSRGEKPAIILQTNPDPDAIASGIALKSYMKQFGKDADIIYDGEIKHQQNRVLINLLGVDLIPASKVKFADYTMFALVDVATHSNCALPKETLPTIVIDHHSVPGSEVTARHTSIFQVGATATIMTNYLRSAGVDVDPPTAAALALGIITDTNNFTRGETMADFDAFKYLMKEAGEEGEELLDQLQSPKFSPSTLDVFARAIQKGKFEEGYFMAWVGEVENLDSIPQAADLMLKREGVMTVFVYGACGDVVKGSARTRDLGLHLGQVLKDAFSDIGSAGGHREMAAVTIPVKVFGKSRAPALRKARIQIKERFYRGVGLKKSKRKRAKKRNNERL
jgi:nanoRNase/pAp phosphatase (c-di-AMP/oligoRNAs hydrolase)